MISTSSILKSLGDMKKDYTKWQQKNKTIIDVQKINISFGKNLDKSTFKATH